MLAVGDESFQKKCIAWMERYLDDGGTLLFCSHSMYHVQKLCRHALWLKDGRVERYGAAADVTQAYLAYHEEKTARSDSAPRAGAGVSGRRLLRDPRRSSSRPATRSSRARRSSCAATSTRRTAARRSCSIGIVRADGTPVYGVATDMDGVAPDAGSRRTATRSTLTLPRAALLPGKYYGCGLTRRIPRACACSTHVERPLVVHRRDARARPRAARASLARRG